MTIVDGLLQVRLGKVCGIPARIEVLPAEVDRIRAAAHGGNQLLFAADRRENFRSWHSKFSPLGCALLRVMIIV